MPNAALTLDLLSLQRAAGNRAVTAALAGRLTSVSDPPGPTVQRSLMSGANLLASTNPHDAALQQIAVQINQYRATKGTFVRVDSTLANRRFGMLRDLDRLIYEWFNTVSRAHASLSANPHTPVMRRLLDQVDKEHVSLVAKTKHEANVLPFDTTGMNQHDKAVVTALWRSIVRGDGKIKLLGSSDYKAMVLSDLAKMLNTPMGRRLLEFLNKVSAGEIATGQQDLMTNIYIGERTGQLPSGVTRNLPKALNDSGEAQSQPLDESKAYLGHGQPVPLGGAPANFAAVAHRRDMREAVFGGQRGIVHGNEMFAFGQGTGAFVRGGTSASSSVAGVPGLDHEAMQPRFITLAHELGHSANQRAGAGVASALGYEALWGLTGQPAQQAAEAWDDPEEFLNIENIENSLRSWSGLELRTSHKTPEGLRRIARIRQLKAAIRAAHNMPDHVYAFSYLSTHSMGAWMTNTGTKFFNRLVDLRNSLEDDASWGEVQRLLQEFRDMNLDQERTDFAQEKWDGLELLVGDRGRDAFKHDEDRTTYDDATADMQNVDTVAGDAALYVRLMDRIFRLYRGAGKGIELPGMGLSVFR